METVTSSPSPEKIASKVFNEEVLTEIAEVYGLSTLTFTGSPASGIITENAFLEDAAGGKYFAKLYDVDDIERQASTYRVGELAAQNPLLPVVLPLMPRGGSYTVPIRGNSFALFPYVEHDDAPVEDVQIASTLLFNTAEALGRIHSTVIPEQEPYLKPIPRWQEGATIGRIENLKRILEIIDSKTELNDFDVLSRNVAQTKLDYLKNAPEAPRVTVPDALCHADFHGANVLHDQNMNIVAICDWDNAGLANPYMDFLNTFYSQVFSSKMFQEPQQKHALAKAFVAGYEAGTGRVLDLQTLQDTFEAFMQERVGTTWPMYQHYIQNDTKNDSRLEWIANRTKEMPKQKTEVWSLIQSAIKGLP